MKRRNDGFTLIEIIISTAILVILAAFLTLSIAAYHRRAQEARYMTEASCVCKAVGLYLLDLRDNGGSEWYFDVCAELVGTDLYNRRHVLKPYLAGKVTRDAYIRSLNYSNSAESFGGIEYFVDGYVIAVNVNGRIEILSYPYSGKDSPSGRKR